MSRRDLYWWGSLALSALALKLHYREADAAALAWMLAPQATLLELAGGHRYLRQPNGEWHSLSAGIALVKGCAGINFMVMSLLVWGRTFAARWQGDARTPALAAVTRSLVGTWLCAWGTALGANLLRILVIEQGQPLLETWLSATQAHRLCGLVVYLGVLTVQIAWQERHGVATALTLALLLQALVLIVVPLFAGHASLADAGFRELAGTIASALLVAAVALFTQRPRDGKAVGLRILPSWAPRARRWARHAVAESKP